MGSWGLQRRLDSTPCAATPQFLRHRITVFLSILLGYACYYLTRNSLTFTAPVMARAGRPPYTY